MCARGVRGWGRWCPRMFWQVRRGKGGRLHRTPNGQLEGSAPLLKAVVVHLVPAAN